MENRDEFPQPAEEISVRQTIAGDRNLSLPPAAAEVVAQLLQSMGDSVDESDTEDVLRELVEGARQICGTQSAGLSLVEHGEERVFRWRAAAGPWTPAVGGVMSCDQELLASALERGEPAVVSASQLGEDHLPAVESALVVPFYRRSEPIGTLWAIAHDRRKRFDDADGLALQALARFAAAACQLLDAQTRGAEQGVPDDGLAQRLRKLEHGETSLREARARLEAELEDSRMIQAISSELIQEDDVRSLYGKILDASVSILDSDFASMQVLEAEPSLRLRLFRSSPLIRTPRTWR